jgi:hypothetical protein
MGKLKIKRKGFGFELVIEGEIEVDQSKIKRYEDYVKEQTDLQIKEQVVNYLVSITKYDEYKLDSYSGYAYQIGAKEMLERLSDYLINNMEG